MKKLIVLILFPLFGFGQKIDLDSLVRLIDQRHYPYDSIIIVGNQIKSINKKVAENEDVDYALADAYFETKQYDKAIEFSKIYLHVSASDRTREGLHRLIQKKYLCYNLSDIYKIRHDTAMALKYLLKIENKYDYSNSCLRAKWKRKLYENIIECYTTLGNKNKVSKYEHKRDLYLNGPTKVEYINHAF